MKLDIIDLFTDKVVESVDVQDSIFNADIRPDIIKDVIIWQLNKSRSGNHKVKTISEISGTTAKPHSQKGTGNARQGSKRSPQFRGGSTVFGPVVRSHETNLNKKVKKKGLISALSFKYKRGDIKVVADPVLSSPSTSKLQKALSKEQKNTKLFIVNGDNDTNFSLSVRNLKNTNYLDCNGVNVYDLINHKQIYITKSAINSLSQRLQNEG